MPNKGFNKILNIGLTPALLETDEAKYVQRSNFLSVFVLMLIVPYGTLFYYLGAGQWYSLIGVALCSFLIFYMNSKQWFNNARGFQMLMLAGWLFYYCLVFGREASVHYLYFVFALMPFSFFRRGQYTMIAIGIQIFFLMFYAIELEMVPISPVLTGEE